MLSFARLRFRYKANMNDEQRQEMRRLCTLIQSEKDPKKFSGLVQQLADLLEAPNQPKGEQCLTTKTGRRPGSAI
jgi:hypothetical protein